VGSWTDLPVLIRRRVRHRDPLASLTQGLEQIALEIRLLQEQLARHSVLEVSPRGEIVWKLEQNDLPGITLAWVTTLEVLPNGHIVLGNCHAGKENPQIIEVTRDKKVVWTFKDFERFGNSLPCSKVIDG